MTTIENIASELSDDAANIQLLYAFNSVGKTRLSIAYKNATKNKNGTNTGIYYNAYSEGNYSGDFILRWFGGACLAPTFPPRSGLAAS